MTHASLFSGIGGFDIAAEWMGWENIFYCEKNPFCLKVLKYYWPHAKTHEDIKKTDFTPYRGKIDVLSGGFPCQPYSLAGKRKGKADDRHLWPEMLRAIKEIQPGWVVGENVYGLINWEKGMVFHEIISELESIGYEVSPYILPACSVNAPHRRYRVWFVARRIASDANNYGSHESKNRQGVEKGNGSRSTGTKKTGQSPGCSTKSTGTTSDTNNRDRKKDRLSAGRQINMDSHGSAKFTSNTNGIRHDKWAQKSISSNSQKAEKGSNNSIKRFGDNANASNASFQRLQGSSNQILQTKGWQEKGREFAKLSQTQYWDEFPTFTPVCGANDGIPRELDGITFSKWRRSSIEAYGNAIVPQLALQLFQTIVEYESLQVKTG